MPLRVQTTVANGHETMSHLYDSMNEPLIIYIRINDHLNNQGTNSRKMATQNVQQVY